MDNPLGAGKEAIAKRLMGQVTPSEQPIAKAVATAIVDVEHRQAQAVERLRQAAELEDVEHGHDAERRREVLLELADAVADDRFTEWFFEELLDVDPAIAKHAGKDAEEWERQKREWYREYHDADLVEAPIEEADEEDVDELADRHLREVYDLGLEDVEADVVAFDRAEAAQRVLAGPVLNHNQIILQAAEALETAQERVQELESRVDELEEENERLGYELQEAMERDA